MSFGAQAVWGSLQGLQAVSNKCSEWESSWQG